jgi:hypothetical protein
MSNSHVRVCQDLGINWSTVCPLKDRRSMRSIETSSRGVCSWLSGDTALLQPLHFQRTRYRPPVRNIRLSPLLLRTTRSLPQYSRNHVTRVSSTVTKWLSTFLIFLFLSAPPYASLFRHMHSVTCIPIAKQRPGKHASTIESIFSLWSAPRPLLCKGAVNTPKTIQGNRKRCLPWCPCKVIIKKCSLA